jgi:flagellar basal-body rod protein FlgB
MFQKLEVFRMSAAMAEHAGQRQAIAAQNMANVDTPGYQASRLASFAELTKGTGVSIGDGFAGHASRTGHLHGNGTTSVSAQITKVKTGAALDGNTVSVDREMLESVSAKREHDRAIAIYKSTLKILQTTLARS